MNAKNCTFLPLLVVILNSKQHVNLDTKDLSKYFKNLKRCTTKLSKIGLFNLWNPLFNIQSDSTKAKLFP